MDSFQKECKIIFGGNRVIFNTVFKDKVVDEYAGFVDHRLYIIIRETAPSIVSKL